MKKPLLFGLSLCIGLSINAQGNLRKAPANAGVKKVTNIKPVINENTAVTFPTKTYSPRVNHSAKANVAPYKTFSSSYNLLTALVSQSNPLNYDKNLNAVSFVARQSNTMGNAGMNSGNTQVSWTTNNGTAWDTLVFGYCNNSGVNYRYPSGAIYNPTGNTTIANAFVVGSGPITNGSGWVGNYFVSGQLNNTNLDNQDLNNGAGPWPTHSFARIDFNIAGGVARVTSELSADNAGTTWATRGYRGACFSKGTFGTTDFTWSWDSINVTGQYQFDGLGDGHLSTAGGYQAWSDNGQIGYVAFFGVDAAATLPGARSYQPIVYKTTNAGTSWARYMAGFDWSTVPEMNSYVFSYDGTNLKPFFTQSHGNDMAVDMNGDLHIAIQIASGATDDQDSLGYTFSGTPNYIMDCYTTSTGWNAQLIDSVAANPGADEASVPWSDQSASPATPYNSDARLQISKSVNGDKLFFVWADNDVSTLTFPILEYPEIRAKGVDVNTRLWTATKSFYASLDYTHFHYASQNAMSPTASSYNIPVTYVTSKDGSNNAIAAIWHWYMDDVSFSDAEFIVGVAETNALVSNVNAFPNPSSANVTLAVQLKEANEITINVFNTVGQLVINKKVNGENGVNKIALATENLASGVYFYEVKVAGNSITNKLILQK